MKTELEKAIEYGQFIISLREKFLKNHREEYQISVNYIISLLGVLGLIAGFGFTAFSSVISMKLFFFGECFVVGSILFLMLNTKNRLLGQFNDTEKRINQSVRETREIKKAIIDKDFSKLSKINSEFDANVNDVSEVSELKIAENIDSHLSLAISASTAGIILIFLSFVVCF
jgi:uncharacterized membrane protein